MHFKLNAYSNYTIYTIKILILYYLYFWRSASENSFYWIFGMIKNIRKIKISCSITNLT